MGPQLKIVVPAQQARVAQAVHPVVVPVAQRQIVQSQFKITLQLRCKP